MHYCRKMQSLSADRFPTLYICKTQRCSYVEFLKHKSKIVRREEDNIGRGMQQDEVNGVDMKKNRFS